MLPAKLTSNAECPSKLRIERHVRSYVSRLGITDFRSEEEEEKTKFKDPWILLRLCYARYLDEH